MTRPHLYDYYEQDERIHESVTMSELSEITGLSRQSISGWSSKGIKSKRIEHVGFVHRMYELFGENGESIMRGTIDQMAEELNYQKNYIEKMLQQGRKDNGGKRLVPLKELWRERFIPVDFEPVAPSGLTDKPKIRRAVKETWKPSKHSRMLFDMNFRKWGVKI